MTVKKIIVDLNKANQKESIKEYSERMYQENKELKDLEKAKKLGKPYKMQPGRKAGKGKGKIPSTSHMFSKKERQELKDWNVNESYKKDDLKDELKQLKSDLAQAYKTNDKPAVYEIQERIDGLTKKTPIDRKLYKEIKQMVREGYAPKEIKENVKADGWSENIDQTFDKVINDMRKERGL